MSTRTILILTTLSLAACPTSGDSETDGQGVDTDETPAGDDVGTCEETAPCGGSPVGDWTIADGCVTEEMPIEDCDGGYITVTDLVMSGTLGIDAAGTYTSMMAFESMSFEGYWPDACLGGATCDQLSAGVDGECSEFEDGCLCTFTNNVGEEPSEDSGTWSADGTTLTIVSADDPEPTEAEFCADDDELWVRVPTGDTQGGPTAMTLLLSRD